MLLLFSLLFSNNLTFAQGTTDTIKSTLDQSIKPTEVQEAGLSTNSIEKSLWNSLRIFLSVLGLIAVIINIYAGVKWMMARGNASEVEDAKKILIQGVIGLLIIFFSWTIVTFVMNTLQLDLTDNSGQPEPELPDIPIQLN